MTDRRRSRRQPPSHLAKRQTTLVVPPSDSQTASYTFYQGNGVNTATELASAALPTQLVIDSSVAGTPAGAVTTGNAATISVSPIFVGTADAKSVVAEETTSAPAPTASTTDAPSSSNSNSSKSSNLPIAAIIMALVAACAIAGLFLFMWHRKRSRRRGQSHSRVSSEDNRGAPAGDVLRKLGGTTYEKSDPFSDAHAVQVADPFADPEKAQGHGRTGSDSFLSMSAPRAPYTHAVSASTGSSASGKVRKKEMEEARQKDMMALNDLVRALDVKERKAEEEGRDRKSLPPVELFKAALVR